MNLRDEFERMMRIQCEIALATTTDGLPHVRIVNFCYAPEERRIYFATLRDNEKVVELAANPNIAFTTVPHNDTMEHIRAHGRAVKSSRTIADITDALSAKSPRIREIIDAVGDDLVVYEITLTEAIVNLSAKCREKIRL
jgi:hypothetical protein